MNIVEGSPLDEGDPQPCRQRYRYRLEKNATQMAAMSRRLTMRGCHPQHAEDVAEGRRPLAHADARAPAFAVNQSLDPLSLGHFSPILRHFSPSFRHLLHLALKIQETGTKTPKSGPQRSKNGG